MEENWGKLDLTFLLLKTDSEKLPLFLKSRIPRRVMVGGCKSVTAGGLRALRMMAAWWQSQKLVFSFFLFGWSVLAQC